MIDKHFTPPKVGENVPQAGNSEMGLAWGLLHKAKDQFRKGHAGRKNYERQACRALG